MIPFRLMPKPDELLFSLLQRTANRAGIPYLDMHTTWLNPYGQRNLTVKLDSVQPLFVFFGQLHENGDRLFYAKKVFGDCSVIAAQTPLLAPNALGDQVNIMFGNSHPRMLDYTIDLIKELRVCPECAQEDISEYGFWYLHRSHHVSGVSVCYRHHTKLHTFPRIKKPKIYKQLRLEESYPINADTITELDIRMADRAAVLHELSSYTLDDTYTAIYNWQSRFPAKTDALEEVKRIGVKYGGLNIPDKRILETFYHAADTNKPLNRREDLLAIMTCVFASNDDYIGNAKNGRKNSPENTAFPCSEPGDIISIFKDLKCGRRFIAANVNLTRGWGCPYCDSKTDYEDMLKRLCGHVGSGEFSTAGKYSAGDRYIKIRHDPCGKIKKVATKDFLDGCVKCSCMLTVPVDEVKRRVQETHPDYELVNYISYNQDMVVRHKVCQQEFPISYANFMMAAKICPFCTPSGRNLVSLKQRIKNIAGNEYEFIEFGVKKDPHSRIVLKHNVCGKTSEYPAHEFFRGLRCPYCNRHVSMKELARYLEEVSCGQYSISHVEKGKCSIEDNIAGKTIENIPKRLIIQELERPTPSEILPIQYRDVKAKLTWDKYQWESVYEELKERFDTQPFHISSINKDPRQRNIMIRSMIKRGIAEKAGHATYRLIKT